MKNKKEDLSDLLKIVSETRITPPVQKVVSEQNNAEKKTTLNFPFVLTFEQMNFLREYVLVKRKQNIEYFSFSNTDAFREGLKLLKDINSIPARPNEIKIPTRKGRRLGSKKGDKKYNTSFSLTTEEINFIYDFIYLKSKDGTDYNKEEFFEEVLNCLKNI